MAQLPFGVMAKMVNNAFDQILNQAILSLGLTSSQSMILGFLCARERDVTFQKDIEAHFNFKHPTVTGLLKRLELKGFVKCYPDEYDHRCKRVEPTEKSMEVCKQIQQLVDHTADKLLSALEEGERESFLQQFEKIAKTLQEKM